MTQFDILLRRALMDANLAQYQRALQSAEAAEPDHSPRYLRERMRLLADPWGWSKRRTGGRKRLNWRIAAIVAALLLLSACGYALVTGQFAQWFPMLGVDPQAPEQSEEVLNRMGTAIQQSETVSGETLTLNAAVWDEGSVRLSLTAKSSNLPKVVDQYTWLNSDGCTARMPEEQWKEYVENKIARESAGEELSKEERDQWFQSLMEHGQGQMELNPSFGVVSREGNTVQLVATMLLDNYREKPEITLHVENLEITGQGMEQPGTRSGEYLLKGPFEFTFTLDKEESLSSVNYAADVPVAYGKVPLRVKNVSVSSTGMVVTCGIDVQGPVNLVDPRNEPVSDKTNIDLDKDLKLALNGLWTKDGKYVDCTGSMGTTGVLTPADETGLEVNWNRKFPYPIDPATVTAVDIGGKRVELSELERLDE